LSKNEKKYNFVEKEKKKMINFEVLKFVLVGNSFVGKTSILTRFK
jgi:GTPase SAR1 family protein